VTGALALTYHAVERGDGPLFVDPGTFAAHLDEIAASGARVVTVSELADLLRSGRAEGAVAITFDDGLASVARVAAPLLAERGLRATVFCVAGRLGGTSAWPSAPAGAPVLELATAAEIAELARSGVEIGCHGMEHEPLVSDDLALIERETVAAKARLEGVSGGPVRAFALPYGAPPSDAARRLLEGTYSSTWTTALATLRPGAAPYLLPRVDAHYVRRPRLLRTLLAGGLHRYLQARRLGATARRALRPDFARTGR
jgi:peptidoglycan/xylan/chitin deacetylase (PgdA/CDA1 family)